MSYGGFDHHHGTDHDLSPSAHLERRLHRLKPLLLQDDADPMWRGQWFLGGSAGLALRDVRRVGDIDVGVTTALWADLATATGTWTMVSPDPKDPRRRCDPPYLRTVVEETEVHAFFAWRRRTEDETRYNDFNLVFYDGTEKVRGWDCIRLSILLRQKIDAVQWENMRPKDIADIRSITEILKGEQA